MQYYSSTITPFRLPQKNAQPTTTVDIYRNNQPSPHLRKGGVLPIHLVLALVVHVRRAGDNELRSWDLFPRSCQIIYPDTHTKKKNRASLKRTDARNAETAAPQAIRRQHKRKEKTKQKKEKKDMPHNGYLPLSYRSVPSTDGKEQKWYLCRSTATSFICTVYIFKWLGALFTWWRMSVGPSSPLAYSTKKQNWIHILLYAAIYNKVQVRCFVLNESQSGQRIKASVVRTTKIWPLAPAPVNGRPASCCSMIFVDIVKVIKTIDRGSPLLRPFWKPQHFTFNLIIKNAKRPSSSPSLQHQERNDTMIWY